MRELWRISPALLLSLVISGCSGNSDEAGAPSRSQVNEDRKLIQQSLAERHPNGDPTVTKWHEPETIYVALSGVPGQDGYSGLSEVTSREEALESVDRSNDTMRELHSPGEELILLELKKLEPIGYRIQVEYDAGQGSDKAHYRDNYRVSERVKLVGGKLVRKERQAVLMGSSSISDDSIITSGK